MYKRFADISKYQGRMVFTQAMKYLDGLIYKLGQAMYLDPLFSYFSQEMPAELDRTVYYYFDNSLDPVKQAEWFISMLPDHIGFNGRLAIDVDRKDAHLDKYTGPRVYAFCAHLLLRDYKPVIYANLDVIANFLQYTPLSKFDLWLALWGRAVEPIPYPWFPGQVWARQFGVYPGFEYGTMPTYPGGPYPKIDLDIAYWM